jgi:hypothetical protein
MLNELLSDWLHWLGGTPCFRIYGKAAREKDWRIIDVFASRHRNQDSPWQLWQGTCVTWAADVIAVGWDFAETVVTEQMLAPVSRQHPLAVAGGRIRDPDRCRPARASEILAHECGHTWQALRLGPTYLPIVGSVTLFHEGPHPWNHFENEASREGRFGGLVNGSVCPGLTDRLRAPRN